MKVLKVSGLVKTAGFARKEGLVFVVPEEGDECCPVSTCGVDSDGNIILVFDPSWTGGE